MSTCTCGKGDAPLATHSVTCYLRNPRNRTRPEKVHSAYRDPCTCKHLLSPTGIMIDQDCTGCLGTKTTEVWGCKIFTECAPLARGVVKVKQCRECDKYEAGYNRIFESQNQA
jgi:hypothetical protein